MSGFRDTKESWGKILQGGGKSVREEERKTKNERISNAKRQEVYFNFPQNEGLIHKQSKMYIQSINTYFRKSFLKE